jgi:hypothetical protein
VLRCIAPGDEPSSLDGCLIRRVPLRDAIDG